MTLDSKSRQSNPIAASFPPSIHHFICEKEILLKDFLEKELHLSDSRTLELLSLGSIFVNKERVFSECILKTGDYVRVHPYPKRYATLQFSWETLVVFQNDDFIVLNKPHGIPVHATLDNAIENVLCQCSQAFKIPLYVTQRLDIPVGGLMVLAKTKTFQSEFNRMLIKRRITKIYEAITEKVVPLGRHLHYMEKSLSAPKIMHSDPAPDRLACELEILRTEKINLGCYTEIRLITGRTHQIRAQLQYLGCSILGDTAYGGSSSPQGDGNIFLRAAKLSFKTFSFELPPWMETN